MLLLNVDTGGETLTQGFVRTRWPVGEQLAAGKVAAWARMFLRSTILWSQVRPLSAALRVSVQPGQPLTSVHSFVVPKSQEARLRLVLAAFLRTTGMGGGEADVPQQEADLPDAFIHADQARMAIQYEKLHTGGLGIHFNLRFADRLPRLIQTLVDFGVPVAYEAQVTPWSPPRELLRTVLYDAARLEEARAAPRDLVLDQRALADRLKRAAQQRPAYHAEECLATTPAAADALRETVANLLSETLYGSFGVAPLLAPLPAPQAEAFAYHVHSHVMNGPPDPVDAEAVVAAATKDEVDRLLSCNALIPAALSGGPTEPPAADPMFTTLTGPPAAPLGGGLAGTAGPGPGAGGGPYLFISYARKDGEIIYPLIDDLAKRGVSMWIDRRILGGDDWVAELESRLINCAGVLALISPYFVASKYCPREVHFADALNRPIVPVSLAPKIELGSGLRFLLNTRQIIDFQRTGSIDDILVSIRRHAPVAWPGSSASS